MLCVNNLPLLMTASVNTRGMKGSCFTAEEREGMYISALEFYLSVPWKWKQKIVFVDNSGWNLESMKQKLRIEPSLLHEKVEIEFLSLLPDLFDITKGKGYNELLLINLALEKSKLLSDSVGFMKVTGRYPIHNIPYFVEMANDFIVEECGDLYIDIKDHKLYDWLRLGWNGHSADVRLFGVRFSFYKEKIGNKYKELNDYEGKDLESLMYSIVIKEKYTSKLICRFRREPSFSGFEGSNLDVFSFSKKQDSVLGKIKQFIGNIFRFCFPHFWF